MIHHWRAWHSRVYTHFIPQWHCYCIPVLWAVIQSAMCWHLWVDVYPSTKCMWACWPFCQGRHPCPLHIAWNLHPSSVDALADIHERSCSFQASALTRMRSPGSYLWCLFLVIVLLLSLSLCHRLGLGLLKSGPQTVSNSGYIFINTLGGGASSRPLCTP